MVADAAAAAAAQSCGLSLSAPPALPLSLPPNFSISLPLSFGGGGMRRTTSSQASGKASRPGLRVAGPPLVAWEKVVLHAVGFTPLVCMDFIRSLAGIKYMAST